MEDKAEKYIGLQAGPRHLLKFLGSQHALDGPVSTRIVGREVWMHIRCCNGYAYDMLNACIQRNDVKVRFLSKGQRCRMGCDKDFGDLVLAEPLTSDV